MAIIVKRLGDVMFALGITVRHLQLQEAVWEEEAPASKRKIRRKIGMRYEEMEKLIAELNLLSVEMLRTKVLLDTDESGDCLMVDEGDGYKVHALCWNDEIPRSKPWWIR